MIAAAGVRGLVVGTALACGCALGGGDTAAPPARGDGGAANGSDSGTSADAIGSFGDAAQGCGASNLTCSSDLKEVVTSDGAVAQTCAADEACECGACTHDVCGAARQAKSTYGCDFYTMNLDTEVGDASGGCYAAFVANTWTTPIHLAVERAGKALDVAQFARLPQGKGGSIAYLPYDPGAGLAPGQVAILFLAHGTPLWPMTCPQGITPAVTYDTSLHGTGLKPAFHVTTDAPIVAFDMYPYGGGRAAVTSASLLLPTSAWDVNYVAVNTYAMSIVDVAAQTTLAVVAAENGTTVTINPVADIAGGGAIAPSPAGAPVTYSLDAGQYLQISQAAELTGSAVLANKPVGMFGGSTMMYVPASASPGDTGHQMIPPVRALGHEYVAVRYRARKSALTPAPPDESVPYRFVGAVDGTKLTYAPAAPQGAPAMLARGQVLELWTAAPFVVSSQGSDHPFYVSAHMTSGASFTDPVSGDTVEYDGQGDPESVNVVPTDQYLDRYVFFTDPTYPETELVVVRAVGSDGKRADVMLDCAGTLSGWTPVGAYEWTRVDLQTGNFQDVAGCSNGVHTMTSAAPFGVTVWGWGSSATCQPNASCSNPWDPGYSQYVSYAYPAGMSVRPVNNVVVSPAQ